MTNLTECDRCHKLIDHSPEQWGCLLNIHYFGLLDKVLNGMGFDGETIKHKDLCRECFLSLVKWTKGNDFT